MATEVVIKNILDHTVTGGKGKYDAFKGKPIAFIFKTFNGLIAVNGTDLIDIISSADYIRVTDQNKIKFDTLGQEWNIREVAPSLRMAKYIYNSETYIVVFGYISNNGTPLITSNSCASDITLKIDETKVPQYIYGCRLDAKPLRTDCPTVSTIFNLGGALAPGQIPL